MFALLALFGDLGCLGGPTTAGLVSGANGDDLNLGILFASIFPIVMILTLFIIKKRDKKQIKR